MADVGMQTGKNGASIAVGFSKYLLELLRFSAESKTQKEMLEALRTIYSKAVDDPLRYKVYEISEGSAEAAAKKLREQGHDAEISSVDSSILITDASIEEIDKLSHGNSRPTPEELSQCEEYERVYGGWESLDGKFISTYYPGGVHYDPELGGFTGGEDNLDPSDPKYDEIINERIANAERIERSAGTAGGFFRYLPERGVMYSEITGAQVLLIDKAAYELELEAAKNMGRNLGEERSPEEQEAEGPESEEEEQKGSSENTEAFEESYAPKENGHGKYSENNETYAEPNREGEEQQHAESESNAEENTRPNESYVNAEAGPQDLEHSGTEEAFWDENPAQESYEENQTAPAEKVSDTDTEKTAPFIHDSSDEVIVNDVIGEKQALEAAKAEKEQSRTESAGEEKEELKNSSREGTEAGFAGTSAGIFNEEKVAAAEHQSKETAETANKQNSAFSERTSETSGNPFEEWVPSSKEPCERQESNAVSQSTPTENHHTSSENNKNTYDETYHNVNKEVLHKNSEDTKHKESIEGVRGSAAGFAGNGKPVGDEWAKESTGMPARRGTPERYSAGPAEGAFNTPAAGFAGTKANEENRHNAGNKETSVGRNNVWENNPFTANKEKGHTTGTAGASAKNAVNATIGTYALNASHLSAGKRFTAADIRLHVVPGASPADITRLGKTVQSAVRGSASGGDKTISTALKSASYTRQVFQAMNRTVGINAEKNISKMLQNYAAGDGSALNNLNDALHRVGAGKIDAVKLGNKAYVKTLISGKLPSTMKALKTGGFVTGGNGRFTLSKKMKSMPEADFIKLVGISKKDAKQLIEYANRTHNFPRGNNPVRLILRVAGNQLRRADEGLNYGVSAVETSRETIRLVQKLVRHNSLQARAARLNNKAVKGRAAGNRIKNGRGKVFDEHRKKAGERAANKAEKLNKKIEDKLNKRLLRQQKFHERIARPAAKVRNFAGKPAKWIKNRPVVLRTGKLLANMRETTRAALRRTGSKFLNTRVGRVTARVGKVTGRVGRTVGKGFSWIGRGLGNVAEALSSAFHTVEIVLLKFLGLYAIALVICAIAMSGLIVLFTVSTSESSENAKDGAPDKFDKSDTVFGMVYDELRWKEIDWANTLRSYGTVDQKTSIPISGKGSDNISFTAEGVDAKTYAQSQAGVDDLLGSWAVDADGKEGIEGPEPFDGALLSDYKVLKNIDAGNSLELRGKPMDGYTSNAKEVVAMGTVFYDQGLETLKNGDMNPIEEFVTSATSVLRNAATCLELHHIPIASDIASLSGWSWTSMLRNYCFPLFTESHRANFRLSSYIMPTKWTDPNLITDTNDDYSYEGDSEALPVDYSHASKESDGKTITGSNQMSDSTSMIVSPNAYISSFDPLTGADTTGNDPAQYNYMMPSDISTADYKQIDDLYRTIETETYMKMSNVRGIVAEGELIMNRVLSNLYPSTVSAVVSQRGQFSAYGSDRWKNVRIDRDSNLYHLVAQIYAGNISILNNSSITEQRAETSSDVDRLISRGYTYVGAAGGQAYFMRPGDEPEPVNGGNASRGYKENTEGGRTVVTNIRTGIKRNTNAAEATEEKTGIHKDARYDMNQETKTANAGDVAVNKNYSFSDIFYTKDASANPGGTAIKEGATAKAGTIGNPTEGGTGKIDIKNRINKDVWQTGFNEILNEKDGWQGFTSCGQLTYLNNNKKEVNDGYGCMTRSDFSYKWTGSFVTDADGNPLAGADTNGAQFLYYGNPDAWGTKRETDTSGEGVPDDNGVLHKKNGQPVYADVSPFGSNEEYAEQIADDSCLKDIRVLSNDAAACWAIDTDNNGGHEDIDDYSPAFHAVNDSKFDNTQKFNSSYLSKALLSGYTWIDKVETTGKGCDVTVAKIRETVEEPEYDENGKVVTITDAYGNKIVKTHTVYYYAARKWHLKHDCVGDHRGYYCGGHLQLRTTGVVYGFSKEEMEIKTSINTVSSDQLEKDPKSAENFEYVPKYLDPDDPYDDERFRNNVNMCLGDDAKLTEFSPDTAPQPDSGVKSAVINKDLAKRIKYAQDLFDIDIMIARHKDEYSFYSNRTGGISTGVWQIDAIIALIGRNEVLNNWTSWTESNMTLASSLVSTDWKEQYGVVDTQTMVGGMTSNSVYETVRSNITGMLEGTVNLEAFGDDEDSINTLKQQRKQYGKAVVNGKKLSIDEELEYADRIRHVKYALTTIGETGYSQQEHGNWYGNLRGNNTDCSGYVANIWRDVLGGGTVPTTSALKAYGSAYVHLYTGSGCGVQPGDIIIRHPDSSDAHALLYVGNLNAEQIYSSSVLTREEMKQDEHDNYVYTIDCSSMTANNDSFAYAVNDPFTKYLSTDGSGSSVRGGNVRFSARPYLQDGLSDYSDTYYIDMEALAKAKRTGKWLRDDFTYLGDSAGNRDYWDMMNDDREGYLSALSTRNVLSIGNTAKTTDKGTEWRGYKPPKDSNNVDPYPNGYASTSGSDEQNAIVEYAMQFLGNPYVWGGTDLEHGTDCSGFTQGVYAYFGYSLPRTTYSQVNSGTEIDSLADAQPGDLLFYHDTGHVAIYIGDGKIVHASNHRDGIKVSQANYSTIEHIRRIADGSSSSESENYNDNTGE